MNSHPPAPGAERALNTARLSAVSSRIASQTLRSEQVTAEPVPELHTAVVASAPAWQRCSPGVPQREVGKVSVAPGGKMGTAPGSVLLLPHRNEES